MARRRFSPEVEAAIDRAAQRSGLDRNTLATFVAIESGGNPNLVNRYGYSGLLQLQPSEHQRLGGQPGTVLDPDANLTTGAVKIRQNANIFRERYGRDPNPSELYLMHQQGADGSRMHWANPDRPAWQNMYETGEGRQKAAARGDAYAKDWARRAIWGNVPDDVKARHGSVDNLTSRDFVKLWDAKVARFRGDAPVPEAPAADPFSGKPVQIADAGVVPQQGADPLAAMQQRPVAEVSARAAPTTVAAAPATPATPGGVTPAVDTSSMLAGLAGFWQAQQEDDAKAERERKQSIAEAKAAIPKAPGPSPMIQGPRLPRVDMKGILAILKQNGVDPDGAAGLGTGSGRLGTRIG